MIDRLRFALVVLPVSFVVMVSWFGVFTFVNSYVCKELNASNQAWSATALWLILAMVGWQLLATEISAALGRKRTVGLSLLLVAVGYAGIALTRNLTLISLFLTLMALTQAVYGTVWVPLLAQAGGDRPGRALATAVIVNTLTAVALLDAGGKLIDALGYRTVFLAIALLALVCAAAFAWLSRWLDVPETGKVISLRQLTWADLAQLRRGAFPALLLLGVAMEPFYYHTLNSLFPNLGRDLHSFSEPAIASINAWGKLPSLLTLFLVGRYIDRLPALRCYALALVAAATLLALMSLASSANLVVVLYGLYFLAQGAVWSSNSTAINASIAPRLRDAAFTLVALTGNAMVAVVGILHNRLLSSQWTLSEMFLLCSLIPVAGGALLLAYSLRRRPAPSSASPST